MKRKVLNLMALCLSLIVMISCGGKKKEVQTFGETFAGYVNAGQLDSIKAVYPTFSFDSVAPLTSDSISVTESDGIYKVNFAGGKWIEVSVGNDGALTVVNSKGVAAFPQDKYDIAVATGMLTDSIADMQAVEMLNDSTYFAWLSDKAKESYNNALTVKAGKSKTGAMLGEGLYRVTCTITIKNNTDQDIAGKDYAIFYTGVGNNDSDIGGTVKWSSGKPGIDVKAGQEASTTITTNGLQIKNPQARLKMSMDEYIAKYYKPSGNEYKEYLSSKK